MRSIDARSVALLGLLVSSCTASQPLVKPSPAGELCGGVAVEAALVVLHVPEMPSAEKASDVVDAFADQPGVLRALLDPEAKLLSLLVRRDAGLDSNRAIQVLRGAGYSARQASDEECQRAEAAIRHLDTIEIPTAPLDVDTTAPFSETAAIITLSDSLRPFRDHFNANKDKLRVVAILSPT